MSTTVKKLVIGFETETGKTLSLSLPYPADSIANGSDTTPVNALAAWVIANQPFEVTLATCTGAEIVETTTTDITVTIGG
ncbi:DUF2922 family protein [Synergistes jonesii]|uniref:DUF2922 family protein n=1 Tax=Synergistes jonesii TaxID=2754 RepID=UPI00248DD2DD|nr:DUF2922 family protein [Synergistes jonesii]